MVGQQLLDGRLGVGEPLLFAVEVGQEPEDRLARRVADAVAEQGERPVGPVALLDQAEEGPEQVDRLGVLLQAGLEHGLGGLRALGLAAGLADEAGAHQVDDRRLFGAVDQGPRASAASAALPSSFSRKALMTLAPVLSG